MRINAGEDDVSGELWMNPAFFPEWATVGPNDSKRHTFIYF